MPFLLLDDNYADDRTVWKLSHGAYRLDVSAMLYCSRVMSDGLVDDDVLPRLMPGFRKAFIDELVHAGRWLPLQIAPGTYEIPEALKHNDTREEIQAKRAYDRARQAAYRKRKRGGTQDDKPAMTRDYREPGVTP